MKSKTDVNVNEFLLVTSCGVVANSMVAKKYDWKKYGYKTEEMKFSRNGMLTYIIPRASTTSSSYDQWN